MKRLLVIDRDFLDMQKKESKSLPHYDKELRGASCRCRQRSSADDHGLELRSAQTVSSNTMARQPTKSQPSI